MARHPAGYIYFSHESWFVSFRIQGKKEHFRLGHCSSREQAEKLSATLVDMLVRLRRAGKEHLAQTFCRQAANSAASRLADILTLLDGVIAGTEQEAPPAPSGPTKGQPIRPATRRLRASHDDIWRVLAALDF